MAKKIINVNNVVFNKAIAAYIAYAKIVNQIANEFGAPVDVIDAHVRIFAQGINIVPVTKKEATVVSVKEKAKKLIPVVKKETVKTVRKPVSLRNRNSFNLHELNAHGIEAIDVNKVVCIDNVGSFDGEAFRAVLTQLQEIGVKEVHFRFYGLFGQGVRKIAAEFTRKGMLVKEGAQTPNQKVRREQAEKEAKGKKYMSDANMASLEASAPKTEKKVAPKGNKCYMSDANMASLEASAPQSVKAKVEEPVVTPVEEVVKPAVVEVAREEIPEPTPLNLVSLEDDPTLEADLDAQFAAFMANELAKEDKKEEEEVEIEDSSDKDDEIQVPSFEDMLNGNTVCQGVITTTVGKGEDNASDMFDDYPEPIVEEPAPAPVAEADNSSVMRGARVRRG